MIFINKTLNFSGTYLKFSVDSESSPVVTGGGGRPFVPFEEGSYWTQRRLSVELGEGKSANQLLAAAIPLLKKEGGLEDAKTVKDIIDGTSKSKSFTLPQSLAIMADCGLSKQDWTTLRKEAQKQGSDLIPPYYRVAEEKEKCIPKITVGDYSRNQDSRSDGSYSS